MDELSVTVRTPLQRRLVEQALAFAQELEQAADAAPDGQVLDRCEQVALGAGREFLRQALAETLQAQAAALEGQKGRRGPVPVVVRLATKAPRSGRSSRRSAC